MINALAEPTLERIQAYVNDCNFNAGDVNYGASEFDLTQGGEAKLWDERCQSVAALQNSPHDVLADGQALQARCDDPRLQAQMSSVGIFATAATLDRVWRAAPGRPAPVAPENRVNLPPVPIEVLPPAPAAVMITTLPPTTAAPMVVRRQNSCLGTFTLFSSLEMVVNSVSRNSSSTAPQREKEHRQCDAVQDWQLGHDKHRQPMFGYRGRCNSFNGKRHNWWLHAHWWKRYSGLWMSLPTNLTRLLSVLAMHVWMQTCVQTLGVTGDRTEGNAAAFAPFMKPLELLKDKF